MRKLALAISAAAMPYQATANDTDITGMYRLVKEQRKIVDTGEIVPGSGSQGFISYDKSGRMLVVLTLHSWSRWRGKLSSPAPSGLVSYPLRCRDPTTRNSVVR
jgi:hypothetical protein